MTTIAELSLTDWWPVRILLLAAAVLCGLVVWFLRRRALKIGVAVLAGLLVLANVAAAVNASYGYYLTFGQAVGLPGPDAASLKDLDLSRVPGNGVVIGIGIPGRVSKFAARSAQVYVPPAWFSQPRPKLPVVLLLHGTPGSPGDWLDGGGAAVTLDAWAAAHHGVAPIVVMPDINGSFDADTECTGAVETYLDKDLPGFIRARFATQPPGRHWAMAGLSEGGTCAATMVLRHSSEFGSFADYSGLLGPRTGDDNSLGDTVPALFGGSVADFRAHEPAWLLTHQRFPGLGAWFETGDADDAPLSAARQLEPLAEAAGMDARLTVLPGGDHSFFVWRQAFADSLPWLAARLGLGGG
ncbi:hypothetical protein FPZ12_045375, partial [Amycolatopsis acidicola]